jgi:phosphoglucosamine mutase
MDRLFGTDGIRGRAYEPPLDELTVRRLGAAVAAGFAGDGEPPRLLLAGDTRESTWALAEWMASSLRASGADVVWGGVLPTPAVSQLLRYEGGFAAGIVISASHNPAEDNGIKILSPSGEKLADDRERQLERCLEQCQPLRGPGLPEPDRRLADTYLDLVTATHDGRRSLEGLHLVVDAAHGAASGLAERLFERLGARVTAIASLPDGSNINRECGATAPSRLAQQVVRSEADAGVALDGDADRALLVDEKGRILDGDDILLAWARHLRADDALPGGRVVATVMSNFGLEKALATDGLELIRCPVGDRSVWLAMAEHGAALGGEQSGHIICSHHGVSGDGLITSSHVLAIAAGDTRPVSSLSDLHRLPQVLINVPVAHKLPFDEVPSVTDALAEASRRLAGRGRILVRYSGTEPLARVMIEGEDAVEIQSLADGLAITIRNQLG